MKECGHISINILGHEPSTVNAPNLREYRTQAEFLILCLFVVYFAMLSAQPL